MPFRVGLLGMGKMAAGFDQPHDAAIQTHLKAILAEPRLKIACVSDTDTPRAAAELHRFGAKADILPVDAILNANVDVLCIASPDGTHLDYIERAIGGAASVIFAEKPIEGDLSRREGALNALGAKGGVLVVNHLRRWIPNLGNWISEARAGKFGKSISATVHYSRGFRHNGVHALDLVSAFLGTNVVDAHAMGETISDYSASDPTRSFHATLNVAGRIVPLFMVGVDGREQTVFEVDIRFQSARIKIFDEKGARAELYQPADINITGFAAELVTTEQFHDDPARLMANVWRNIADHLDRKAPLACFGSAALSAYELSDSISKHLNI